MRFGANYTPSKHWWHTWLDFEPDSIRRDLDQLADLGLDHVRVFPIWSVFQPNRGVVREKAVEQLLELVRIGARAGLDVTVDGIQGHLSSFDFYPSWTQTWHHRNVFTDPDVVEGQVLLLRALATALRGEPNFLGMTLAKLFSRRLLSVPWLMHLDVYRQQLQPILLGRSKPDFVGLNTLYDWIVLEAKGRTNEYEESVLQSAKVQTQQLSTIQGNQPVLRVGSLAYFSIKNFCRRRGECCGMQNWRGHPKWIGTSY